MLAWMIYALLVAVALGAAALLAEKAAKARRLSTRWPWLVAMVASLLLPVVMATASLRLPDTARHAATAAPITLRDSASIPLASSVIDWSGARPYTASVPVNTVLRDIWLASSFTLLLFLGVSTVLFHRRKRGWVSADVCAVPVLVSDRVGPAVVGLIRSRIVVPAWVLREPAEQQRYVMAHEQSHLGARDPLLVACALLLVVAMPWSPVLWWQFHRLRCAIEVDCDARVLRAGGDLADYCETLIQVGQNQSEFTGAVTAMSESRSFLERRIRIMLSTPRKWAGALAFVLISVSLGLALFATQVMPPVAASAPSVATTTVAPALLDAYVGSYELSDYSLVTVARKGDGLTVSPIGQFLAQGTIDVVTVSETTFVIPSIDVSLEFVKGAEARATSIIVREHGAVVAEPRRIDDAAAQGIRDGLAARVKAQAPFPDSEKALQRILTNTTGGEGMSPYAAPLSAPVRDGAAQYLAFLGPVESYRFEGVTDYGWDIYDVQHKNGAQQVFIQLDSHGLLVTSVMRRQ